MITKDEIDEHSAYLAEKARADDLQFLLDRINSEVVPGVRDSGDAGVYLMKKLEAENTRLRETLIILENKMERCTFYLDRELIDSHEFISEALEGN